MNFKYSNIKQTTISLGSALLVFLLFSLMLVNNEMSRSKTYEAQVHLDVELMSDLIEYNLNQALSAVKIIEVVVKDSMDHIGMFNESSVNSFAQLIIDANPHVDLITIAPGGVISYVYPFEANQQMIGLDLMNASERRWFTTRAIGLRTTVAQGPVLTKQGKYHIINRLPLFLNSNQPDELWGLVNVSVDFEQFLQSLNIKAETELYHYALFLEKSDGSTDLFWGNEEVFQKKSLEAMIKLPELTWVLSIYPKNGWSQFSFLDIPFVLIGLFLTVYTYLFTRKMVIKYQHSHVISLVDSLTGCNNRRGFDQMINENMMMQRLSALMVIDVDNFKDVNDTLGHTGGDLILKDIASVLRNQIRDSDSIFRIGGDEFVIILQNVVDFEELELIVQRLIDKTFKTITVNHRTVEISISVGVSLVGDSDRVSVADAFNHADQNLYSAKERGKNQFAR